MADTTRTGGSRAAKSTGPEVSPAQAAQPPYADLTTKQGPFNDLQDAENEPAFEIHLGEIRSDGSDRTRVCIIWINGRRWQGLLLLEPAGS